MANMSFTNNAATTLASGITNVASSLTVTTSTGALFPTLTGGQYFYCTLANNAGTVEIVKVTARTTDTFTITRGQDNTSAVAWNAGDKVELRLVAASLNNFPKLDEANTFSSGVTQTIGTLSLTNALTVANGGTGATTLTANNVLLGNGTSAPQVVAPGTSGNLLQSNGTTWTSAAVTLGGGRSAIFTTGTATTWTIPTGVTNVRIIVVGGGGGSPSSTNSGGGGGGGAAILLATSVTPGNTLTYTVGAAGAVGGAGGTTSVSSGTQTINTVSASGGAVGGAANAAAASAGIGSGTGAFPMAGQPGGPGITFTPIACATLNLPGQGGAGAWVGGGGGKAGVAATSYGGGGGGGGFAGQSGLVIFEY